MLCLILLQLQHSDVPLQQKTFIVLFWESRAILLNQLLNLRQRIAHMDSLALIQLRSLQNPKVEAAVVAEGH